MEQLCHIAFKIILCYHSENNDPHHVQNVSFVKVVPEFEKTENPKRIVLDDLMEYAYSTKLSE